MVLPNCYLRLFVAGYPGYPFARICWCGIVTVDWWTLDAPHGLFLYVEFVTFLPDALVDSGYVAGWLPPTLVGWIWLLLYVVAPLTFGTVDGRLDGWLPRLTAGFRIAPVVMICC